MNTQLSPIEQNFLNASQNLIPSLKAQEWIDKYRVDFFIPEKNLVIELDGHDFHKTKEQRTNDAKRQRFLESKGYRLIRFTGTEIHKDVNNCVKETIDFLATLKTVTFEKEDQSFLYCTRMQDLISFLSIKHGFNLDAEDDGITLFLNDNFDVLSINKNGKFVVSVAHYFILNGDIAYDPKIEFLIISSPIDGGNEWIPISITQYAAAYLGYPAYRNCIDFNEDASSDISNFEIIDYETHREIANLSEDWAKNLIAQGWLEESTVKTSNL